MSDEAYWTAIRSGVAISRDRTTLHTIGDATCWEFDNHVGNTGFQWVPTSYHVALDGTWETIVLRDDFVVAGLLMYPEPYLLDVRSIELGLVDLFDVYVSLEAFCSYTLVRLADDFRRLHDTLASSYALAAALGARVALRDCDP